MELKRRRISLEQIFGITYFAIFILFLIIGFNGVGATVYSKKTTLKIPSINLTTDVTELKLENSKLNTPDEIVGSFSNAKNKTLLIGHSSTVFQNLKYTNISDPIIYNDHIYNIYNIYIAEKSDINMNELLKSANQDTIVLMTCAGVSLGNNDFTHRLIIFASRV